MRSAEARIIELERKLAAHERTIAVLSDSVERQLAEPTSDMRVAIEMMQLESIVRERTEECANRSSALEQALRELHQMQDQLLQANKLEAIGQLAAGVAHEINTPMQYIGDNARFLEKAFADLLAAPSADPEIEAKRRRRLEMICARVPRAIAGTLEGVESVSRIVRALKEFTHPGAGEKEQIDLNEAVRSTVALSRGEWKYASSIEIDLDASIPPAYGFRHEIQRALLNLLVNAAHAVADRLAEDGGGASPGVIRVSTRHAERGVAFEIVDNGTGIPAAIRSKVFDPFFTTKPIGKGTGQGLAIVRGIIVEQHGGAIDLWSDNTPGSPTRGTRFTVVLPNDEAA
jgi:two-component system NtrC family sensor kinase